MPRLIVTPLALADIARCRNFLHQKSPASARRAINAIRQSFERLTHMPESGRPSHLTGFRELIIEFGDSGYIARYVYRSESDLIQIVALWHQHEAGY
jgi:plasmid stabilization system protein ParE